MMLGQLSGVQKTVLLLALPATVVLLYWLLKRNDDGKECTKHMKICLYKQGLVIILSWICWVYGGPIIKKIEFTNSMVKIQVCYVKHLCSSSYFDDHVRIFPCVSTKWVYVLDCNTAKTRAKTLSDRNPLWIVATSLLCISWHYIK